MLPKSRFFPNFNHKNLVLARLGHTWSLPKGYQTPVNISNCVTRQKEPFVVKNKNVVTWYTCGPTVYDSSHIGHASCYVKLDIIQRILRERFGLNLVTCMNITDIDDKIIKKSHETKRHYKDLSKMYEQEFMNDLAVLGIPLPNIVVRVTDNISLIVDFIRKLEGDGVAYKGADNSVYFDVSKGCNNYGKLQKLSESLPDPKNPYKKAAADFALWKSVKNKNEPHFESPWGIGRPGWHIECSALATQVFGKNIDVHAGGLDLRFPHHENEEAQSCAFHNTQQWVNYWVHTGHLHLKDSIKMSKSLNNTISIKELLTKFNPEDFRLACAMSHYFSPMEFSWDIVKTASNVLKVYKNFANTCADVERGIVTPCLDQNVLSELLDKSISDIDMAYCDDFNTPLVIETLNQIVAKVNPMLHSAASSSSSGAVSNSVYYISALKNTLWDTLEVFGIDLVDSRTAQSNAKEFINMLVNVRQNVRNIGLNQKNGELLKICDSIRSDLNEAGVTVKDYGNVTTWST